MINVKLNYVLLQLINGTFFLLSYHFVKSRFPVDAANSVGELLLLLGLVLAGAWAFHTNRIFYLLAKRGAGVSSNSKPDVQS